MSTGGSFLKFPLRYFTENSDHEPQAAVIFMLNNVKEKAFAFSLF